MPITKIHFELGINPEIEAVMQKLAAFLQDHPDEAYSFEELWHREFEGQAVPGLLHHHVQWRYLESPNPLVQEDWVFKEEAIPLEQRRFVYALEKLIDHGVVQERVVGGTRYYAIGTVRITQVLKS